LGLSPFARERVALSPPSPRRPRRPGRHSGSGAQTTSSGMADSTTPRNRLATIRRARRTNCKPTAGVARLRRRTRIATTVARRPRWSAGPLRPGIVVATVGATAYRAPRPGQPDRRSADRAGFRGHRAQLVQGWRRWPQVGETSQQNHNRCEEVPGSVREPYMSDGRGRVPSGRE